MYKHLSKLPLALLLAFGASGLAQAGNAGCQAGNTCGGGGHQQAVGYSFLPSQGGIAFSDNGLLYQPAFGPAIDTTVRLMEEEKARSGVTSVGEFRLSFESYVTAAEGDAESGMVRLYERGGGYQTYRLPMGVSCAEGAGSACAYERHAVEDNELVRMRGGEVPGALSLSALTVRKVNELLGRLPVSERQHAYIRRVGDGTVEVYGTTRGVAGGYEMWLSAVVDEMGLSIELEYDTHVAGLFRLSRIKDASGLSVRVYYPDTEPTSGSAFADEGLSAGLLSIWRELSVNGKRLVTSMVDPYGNRWRMDYADATSGVRLRGLEEMLSAAMVNPNQGVTYAAAVLQMNHPRLVRLIDAVGVESRIEWGCGSSGGDLAADSAELSRRVANLTAHLGCLGDLESGQVEDGVRPLYRRVSSTTVVGYGTTRYSRLWRSEGELIKGWVVESAGGELQRMETRFNTPSAPAQSWMSEYLEGRGRYTAVQHPEVVGSKPAWVNGSYDAFWGLISDRNRLVTQELLYRNSLYWGPKALEAMQMSGWTPTRIRTVEERLDLDKAEWTHFYHDYVPGQDGPVLSSLVMATHHVGEDSWTWVAYPNQRTENSYRDSASNAGVSGEVKGVPGLTVKMVETPTGRQAQTSYVEYNERWNPVRVWDAVGRKQEMEYAGNGRDAIALRVLPVEGTTGSAQEMVRLGYNDRRQVVWERDVRGNVTCYQYRDTAPYEGTSVKVPLGSSSYTADPQSACQDATRQTLTSTLNITRTRLPLWTVDGTHPWTESDPQGPVLSVVDVLGRDGFGIEHRAHYEQGYAQESSGEGKTLRFEGRDAFGRAADVLVNGQLQAHYEYEALHVHRVINGEGQQIEYGVDAQGRVQSTSERDATGTTLSETRVEYDASGGILRYWKGAGMGMWEMTPQVSWSYAVSGRPISRTQQDGIVSRIEYEAYSGKVSAVVNALNERHELSYNVDGSVAESRVVDAGVMPSAVVRRVGYNYRDGMNWDRYGRTVSLTDNGRVRNYHYRADDPKKLLDGDQPVVDSLGREGTRVTTRIGDYDALGRATGWQMDNALGNRELYQSLSFDQYGRVEKIATEGMMARASYEPIPAQLGGAATPGPGALESGMPGLPQELYGALKRLSYDLNRDGSVEATQTIDRYGAGEIHARALKSRNYYLDGRTPDATSDGLTPMAPSVKRSFQYTASGKIKEIGGFADGSTKSYGYDGVGGLKTMNRYQGGAWSSGESYHYDEKGNRTGLFETDATGMETHQKQGGEYGYSNRIRTYRSWVDKQPLTCGNLDQQSHDRLGRLTIDPTHCEKGDQIGYTWDREGNLQRIQRDAGNFIDLTYQWDGHVQTRRETQSGSVTKDWSYVWVGNQLRQIRDNQHGQRLVMSFNGDGFKTYTYDASGTMIDETVTLLLRDHLGSLIGTADQTGTLQQTITYDDNGNVEEHRQRNPINGQLEVNPGATITTIGLPFGYAGYLPLTDNLYLTHHRVYHTVLARWLSQDPIGEMGGQDLYSYVNNDPIAQNDPSGLMPRSDLVAEVVTNPRLGRLYSALYARMRADYNSRGGRRMTATEMRPPPYVRLTARGCADLLDYMQMLRELTDGLSREIADQEEALGLEEGGIPTTATAQRTLDILRRARAAASGALSNPRSNSQVNIWNNSSCAESYGRMEDTGWDSIRQKITAVRGEGATGLDISSGTLDTLDNIAVASGVVAVVAGIIASRGRGAGPILTATAEIAPEVSGVFVRNAALQTAIKAASGTGALFGIFGTVFGGDD